MKSNALSLACLLLVFQAAQAQQPESAPQQQAAATAPATAPEALAELQEDMSGMMRLLAVGLIVLAGWIFTLFTKKRKFALAKAPNRPNRINVTHLAGLLLIYLLPGVIVAAISKYYLGREPGIHMSIYTNLASQGLLIAGCLAVGATVFNYGLVNGMGLRMRHWLRDSVYSVLMLLGSLPIVVGLLMVSMFVLEHMINRGLLPEDVLGVNQMLQYLHYMGTGGKALALISGVIMAPLAEELFFRGMLQSMLRQHLKRPWVAILLTSTIFAMLHAPIWKDVVPLFALSVALGYGYERFGRLLVPVLVHALFNGLMMTMYLMRT